MILPWRGSSTKRGSKGGAFHSGRGCGSATSRRARQSSIPSPIAVLAPSVRMDERLNCGGGLFAELHVDALGTFTAPLWLRFEADPRALVKRWETRALQRRDMQEHILAAIIRRDEAESSRMIEELDRTALTHGKLLFPFQIVRR